MRTLLCFHSNAKKQCATAYEILREIAVADSNELIARGKIKTRKRLVSMLFLFLIAGVDKEFHFV